MSGYIVQTMFELPFEEFSWISLLESREKLTSNREVKAQLSKNGGVNVPRSDGRINLIESLDSLVSPELAEKWKASDPDVEWMFLLVLHTVFDDWGISEHIDDLIGSEIWSVFIDEAEVALTKQLVQLLEKSFEGRRYLTGKECVESSFWPQIVRTAGELHELMLRNNELVGWRVR